MTIRDIVIFPDQRLREKAQAITVFDEALKDIVTDLLDTIRAAPGVGITGPHIGVMQRIAVLELQPGEVRTYVNPEIIWASDERQKHQEGSISMSGAQEIVERAAKIRVTYQDLDGTAQTEEADGFHATCLQHEIDQLDGIFWTQRLSRLKRDVLVRKWEKMKKR